MLVAGLAVVAMVGTAATGLAAPPGGTDWGTVVPSQDGLQANGWGARAENFGGVLDERLFESADPTMPNAPQAQGSGGVLTLAPGGKKLGKASALLTRSMRNSVPQSLGGKEKVPAAGVAYSDAGAASGDLEIALPKAANGTARPPLLVHLDVSRSTAVSRPGQPVRLDGGQARGHVTYAGTRIDVPASWPANHRVRVPQDPSLPAVAMIVFNEQVTTDLKGRPTLGSDGRYLCDPKATSGYTNAVHITILGGDRPAEATINHAAVIRDPAKTDKLAPKLPPLPDFVRKILNRSEPGHCA
ncbi:hypothetical protein [Allokutzneria albata]|uniref:hypothetical protein n=1 Tax=Allokutzneria albata TaxID=211114 RepID=UPI0009F334B5|nr:hypothetical protein [Allokutzneria albata]